MTKMPVGLALVLAAGLSACVYAEPGVPIGPLPPEPAPDACGASELQFLVGQNQRVLQTMRFSQPTRIIGPGQAVTMDYLEFRLNISYDRAGRIDRVFCG